MTKLRFFLYLTAFLMTWVLSPSKILAGALAQPRLASLNACTDELLLDLAEKKQIAGLSRYPIQGMKLRIKGDEELRSLSGGIEEVLALSPDIILAGDFTRRETLQFLKRFGYQVEIFTTPETFEDIFSDIRRLSKLTGHPDKGELLIRRMEEKMDPVKKISAPAPMRDKEETPFISAVFFGVAGHVVGGGTFENAILEKAGAVNGAQRAGIEGHRWLTLESLIRLKPDFLFIMEKTEKLDSAGQFLLRHPALQKALPNTSIYALQPGMLNCGSPKSAEVVDQIRKALVRSLP